MIWLAVRAFALATASLWRRVCCLFMIFSETRFVNNRDKFQVNQTKQGFQRSTTKQEPSPRAGIRCWTWPCRVVWLIERKSLKQSATLLLRRKVTYIDSQESIWNEEPSVIHACVQACYWTRSDRVVYHCCLPLLLFQSQSCRWEASFLELYNNSLINATCVLIEGCQSTNNLCKYCKFIRSLSRLMMVIFLKSWNLDIYVKQDIWPPVLL